MSSSNLLFDPTIRELRRSRALRLAAEDSSIDYVLQEAADCLLDRLPDIKRTFDTAIDIGSHTGLLTKRLHHMPHVTSVVSTESQQDLLDQCPTPSQLFTEPNLPFPDNSVDLVISCMSLHWVNDLPGLLHEVRRILKPNGLFLASFAGEETLRELRESFARAELEIEGGISPRVSPMVTIKDAGSLLQATGFENPIVDKDRITVDYASPIKLMQDLRAMGETNAMLTRRKTPLKKSTLFKMLEFYQSLFTKADGRCLATFDFVTMTGWKPAANL